MDWKLLDKEGNFLQEVNCQYDACDFAAMMYCATKLEIDFQNQTGKIIEVGEIVATEDEDDEDF